MPKNRKDKKQVQILTPGIHARKITTQINERNNALKCDEDTIIRTEIHGIITSCLKEGRDTKYIVDVLSKNPRYEKFNIYFENWITDKIKKVAKREAKQK